MYTWALSLTFKYLRSNARMRTMFSVYCLFTFESLFDKSYFEIAQSPIQGGFLMFIKYTWRTKQASGIRITPSSLFTRMLDSDWPFNKAFVKQLCETFGDRMDFGLLDLEVQEWNPRGDIIEGSLFVDSPVALSATLKLSSTKCTTNYSICLRTRLIFKSCCCLYQFFYLYSIILKKYICVQFKIFQIKYVLVYHSIFLTRLKK